MLHFLHSILMLHLPPIIMINKSVYLLSENVHNIVRKSLFARPVRQGGRSTARSHRQPVPYVHVDDVRRRDATMPSLLSVTRTRRISSIFSADSIAFHSDAKLFRIDVTCKLFSIILYIVIIFLPNEGTHLGPKRQRLSYVSSLTLSFSTATASLSQSWALEISREALRHWLNTVLRNYVDKNVPESFKLAATTELSYSSSATMSGRRGTVGWSDLLWS